MRLVSLSSILISICAAAGWTLAAYAQEATGTGTGFFVNSDGWIVTNAHVVAGCQRVAVPGHGARSSDEIKIDEQNDLAVLRVMEPNTPPLPIRNSEPRLGEDVAAFGYPLSTLLSSSVKITTGNVNSLLGMGDDTRYLQISTPIQPGNSGGPLVDRSGALLGITTATLKPGAAGEGSIPQNVNFAVRASVIRLFLQGHRIAFQATEALGTELATADLAEKVARSVVQVVCYGKAAPQVATSPPIQSNSPTRIFRSLDSHDVIGFDYGSQRGVSQVQCEAACRADRVCQAFTYNKSAHVCFLKNDAVLLVRNKDAFASVVDELSTKVVISSMAITSGLDMVGGDYARLKTTFVGCYVACERDASCRAFAFVQRKNSCWLKGAIGIVSSRPGVDLGIK